VVPAFPTSPFSFLWLCLGPLCEAHFGTFAPNLVQRWSPPFGIFPKTFCRGPLLGVGHFRSQSRNQCFVLFLSRLCPQSPPHWIRQCYAAAFKDIGPSSLGKVVYPVVLLYRIVRGTVVPYPAHTGPYNRQFLQGCPNRIF